MTATVQRIVVAMSGGVDSSVSAALLKEQGYAVEGAFIVTWQAPWLPCTWREERRDAMRVAARLRIPFHTVDLSVEYERDVVRYLVREYAAGRTPNPDVMCNKQVKFGAFFDWAMAHGFDAMATGHYARVGSNEGEANKPNHATPALPHATHCTLLTGKDSAKDQTYFLWTLTQRELLKTFFPVGGYEKQMVRELAKKFGLPTAAKKDSQGVCFLGQLDMKEFLSHYIQATEGIVLNEDGAAIGVHDGAVFYTLGQRHGFTVTKKSPTDTPLYVIAKDVVANTITVAPQLERGEEAACSQIIRIADTNWIAGVAPTRNSFASFTSSYTARLRYRQPLFSVHFEEIGDGTATLACDVPQRYVPAGQSLVIYQGETCVGGGIIA